MYYTTRSTFSIGPQFLQKLLFPDHLKTMEPPVELSGWAAAICGVSAPAAKYSAVIVVNTEPPAYAPVTLYARLLVASVQVQFVVRVPERITRHVVRRVGWERRPRKQQPSKRRKEKALKREKDALPPGPSTALPRRRPKECRVAPNK